MSIPPALSLSGLCLPSVGITRELVQLLHTSIFLDPISRKIRLSLLVQSKSLWLPLISPSHHWVIGMQHALWPGLIPCHLELECSVGREGEVQRGHVAGEGNGIDAEASEYALDFKESVVAMVSKHGQEEKDQSVS